MRIAIVHENWGAGAARCAQDLAMQLQRRHEILYFPRSLEETAESIAAELARFKPDIVHCHSFYGNLPYTFLEEVSQRYSTCFTVHDPRPIGTIDLACWNCEQNKTCRRCPLAGATWRQFLRNRYYQERRLKRRVHNACSASMRVVAPSRWMMRRLERQETNRFKLNHIPYGIDLDHFRPIRGSRGEFDLPADRPIILFSAWYESKRSVGVRKGLSDLGLAFIEQVLPQIPNAILAVAGESFVPNHPNVRPLGLVPLDRLPRLLSAADVYVLPTLADNLPYTILEAMGCGVPVVATEVGGIPEQIVHGETGLVVPPANSNQLAVAILRILHDIKAARMMGENGRKRAQLLFSMDNFVRAYEALFQEMVNGASAR